SKGRSRAGLPLRRSTPEDAEGFTAEAPRRTAFTAEAQGTQGTGDLKGLSSWNVGALPHPRSLPGWEGHQQATNRPRPAWQFPASSAPLRCPLRGPPRVLRASAVTLPAPDPGRA